MRRIMATATNVVRHEIKFIPSDPEPPTLLDRVQKVAGTAIAIVGLAIVLGAAFCLIGSLIGVIAMTTETVHSFLMIGIISAIGGIHLAKGTSPSISVTAGAMGFSTK